AAKASGEGRGNLLTQPLIFEDSVVRRARCLAPHPLANARDLSPPRAGRGKSSYSAVQPPSIDKLVPVIWAASSPHRNSARAATCSEVTNSLVGCAASSTSWMT